ncbi:MAG: Rrf2 family transcriptional regulator [Phycisphaerae bacterium]
MISRTVEYALRAVVWLASRHESSQTTRQIADATQVPANYLAKVLQTLVDAGIVTSQRGLGGGFRLARDPAVLSVLDVVNAVDPLLRIHACPLKLASHSLRLCALHQRLDDAAASVERAFAASKIGELLSDDNAGRPLCPAPAPESLRPSGGNLARGRGDPKTHAPNRSASAPRPTKP